MASHFTVSDFIYIFCSFFFSLVTLQKGDFWGSFKLEYFEKFEIV